MSNLGCAFQEGISYYDSPPSSFFFLDPKIYTKEEKSTPLHFAAFYHENLDEGGKGKPNKANLSANMKILQYLVNLRGNRKVEVSHTSNTYILLVTIKPVRSMQGISMAYQHYIWRVGVVTESQWMYL